MPVTTTLEELMEAGVHFGHQTRRWNPKMLPFIWGKRNGIYIIDLTKTLPLLQQAYSYISEQVAAGKKVAFVGTKKQASDIIREEAQRVGAAYINKRWLGGTLTNSSVIRSRINRFRELEEMKANGHFDRLGKKEAAMLNRQLAKLERTLGGLKDLRGLPDILVIIDQVREINAVTEARKAGVETICLLDTNCDPSLCDMNIPGNDDAIKSIRLITSVLADAVQEGKTQRESALAARKEGATAGTVTRMKPSPVTASKAPEASKAEEEATAEEKQPVAAGAAETPSASE